MTRVLRSPFTALGVLALAIRLPAFVATRHLTFDDGVFGASAVAMRDGGIPFREVFSSQGPVFLPLVWLADVIGLRSMDAPRVLAVASGVAITVLVYDIGRRTAGRGAGVVAAMAVTASGSVLWTSGPLAADGPGLALALGAADAAVSYRHRPRTRRVVLFAALIAAAFSLKSLFALPVAAVLGWVLLERRAGRHLLLGLGVAAAVVLSASVPWGLADVWDQAVAYHLDAAGSRTPGANLNKVFSTAWDRDLAVLALAVLAAATALFDRFRPTSRSEPAGAPTRPDRWGGELAPLAAWLALVVAVLTLEHPMWRPHLTHLVPPLALVAAYVLRSRLRMVAAVMAVVAAAHVATNRDILWPRRDYVGAEAAAVQALSALPDHAWAISDEPGFVWRAGLRTPDDLVDASILRIDSGRITAASLVAAVEDHRVCAVLVWSHRFARFDLGRRLASRGFEVVADYGPPRSLLVRPCPATS